VTRAIALGALLAVTAAHAESVVLVTRGGPEERAQLEASVGELLRRLRITVVSEAPSGEALARVAVVLGDVDCVATITDRHAQPVVVRRVARSASSQVTVEAVAHVVQSAVEELAQRERTPPTVKQQRLSPPPIVAPSLESSGARPPVGVELGAMLTGRALAQAAPFNFGAGMVTAVRLQRDGPWSPRLSLLGAYTGPFTTPADDTVQISTQQVSVRLLAGARLEVGRFAFDGMAGGGFDTLFTETRTSSQLPQTALRDRTDWSPMLGVLLAARISLTPSTGIFVAVSADVDLLPRRFVSDVLGERTVLLETWRVRPAVLLGFSFDVVGERRVQ
jgi:hypothetical protein